MMQWMSILSFYSMLQSNKEWVADHVHHVSLHLFPMKNFMQFGSLHYLLVKDAP
jgi:hypothetical protein